MYSLFANGDGQLIVNGELVHVRDMHRDFQSDPYVQRSDDDATTLDDSSSDMDEIPDPENEADKNGMIDMFREIRPRDPFVHMQSKTSMNEGEDPSLESPSKGKEKEHERISPTPEPQPQNQSHGMPDSQDLLRFLIGGYIEKTQRHHRSSPYEKPGVKFRGPTAHYEDVGDVDFVEPRWHRDMFPTYFMPSFRAPRRKPLPEFVIGPSRITLDDL